MVGTHTPQPLTTQHVAELYGPPLAHALHLGNVSELEPQRHHAQGAGVGVCRVRLVWTNVIVPCKPQRCVRVSAAMSERV